MATKLTLRDCILSVLQSTRSCELDDLVNACPGCTWNEIFLELDRLSRSGEVRIAKHGRFGYSLAVVQTPSPTGTRVRPVISPR